jgi:hypothetical protein
VILLHTRDFFAPSIPASEIVYLFVFKQNFDRHPQQLQRCTLLTHKALALLPMAFAAHAASH